VGDFPPMPRKRIALAAVGPGGTVNFSTSVPISLDGSHSFSLTGWFRLRAAAGSGTLIGKSGEFVLGVKQGRPYARLAGQLASVGASAPLEKGWHFLAATYATTGANAGQLSLYVDGGLTAQGTLSNVGVGPTSNPLVAGGGLAADVWCVCAFDRALAPGETVCEWTPMQDAAGTAASFCFMKPPARDQGPHGIPIGYLGEAAERIATPGVSFGSSGYALPGAGDGTDVSSGPYTVQAWIYPGANPPAGTQFIFAEGPADGANVSLGVTLVSGSLTLVAQHGSDVVTGGNVKAETWQNAAVTYNGTTLTLYLDGQSCGTKASGASTLDSHAVALGAAVSPAAPTVAGSFQGTIQSIDIWSRALEAADIAAFAARLPGEVVGEEPSFLASYSLGGECSNLVNGVPVTLSAGAQADELVLPPSTEADTPSEPHDLGESLLPISDFRLDVDGAKIEAITRGFLADLRVSYRRDDADELIARVSAGLETHQRRLLETGLLPEGSATVKREGNELVVYSFTAEGAIEVDRLPATMTCTDWYIELAVSLLGGVLTILGLKFPAGRLARAVQNWMSRYPNVGRALGEVLEEEITMRTITSALKIFYDASALGPILYSTFASMSWWELAFFLAAVVLQLIEIIAPPTPATAAFFALVVAKIGTVVVQLGVVVSEKPAEC
jgi:concanavalin A-like lectin/glucanase superfamily protein